MAGSAGYVLTGQDLRNLAQSIATQYVSLLQRTEQIETRMGDYADADLNAAYQTLDNTNYAQMTSDLRAMLATCLLCLRFMTYEAPTASTARLDNTKGSAAVNLTVPVGWYALATNDPTVIEELLNAGVDKSLSIRKMIPPQVI